MVIILELDKNVTFSFSLSVFYFQMVTKSLCMHAKLLQSCLTLQPYGLQPARLLCPLDSPGKNTGVCCHAFSRESSQPRNRTCISMAGFFTTSATWEAQVIRTYILTVLTQLLDKGNISYLLVQGHQEKIIEIKGTMSKKI